MDDFYQQQTGPAGLPSAGELPRHAGRRLLSILLLAIAMLAAIAGVIGWMAVGCYNTIQLEDERVEAEWQQVLIQHKRRLDLVPNLIAAVKSYTRYESKVFDDLAQAQARIAAAAPSFANAKDARAVEAFEASQRQLTASLAQLLAVARGYPELKASELYRDLMAQLEGTENRIAYARARHVDAVARFNLAIRQFPGKLVAEHYGYTVRPKLAGEPESVLAQPPLFEAK